MSMSCGQLVTYVDRVHLGGLEGQVVLLSVTDSHLPLNMIHECFRVPLIVYVLLDRL